MRKLLLIVVMVGCCIWFNNAQDNQAQEVLRLLNELRTEQGVPPVVLSLQLTQAAQQHSDDMALNQTLSHVGSDGSQFWQRIARTDYNMISGAENVLSRQDLDAEAAFQQWRESNAHFANMVNPVYVEAGIASAVSSSGVYYYTLVLASRADFVPPTATPSPTFTPTAIPPTTTPLPTSTLLPTVTSTPIPPTVEPTFPPLVTITPFPGTTFTPTAIIPTLAPPTLTPTPTYDLQLIYDRNSFSLVNVSRTPLYLLGLSFESSSGTLLIDRWDSEFLSASLTEFPSGGCLQAWGLEINTVLDEPQACRVRHGWVAVNDRQTFWQDADIFTVYRFDEPIGVCAVGQGQCSISLGNSLNDNEQQTTSPVSSPIEPVQIGSSDVQLIYSQDSFTILNTSGETLDFTGLGFAGSSGLLSISAWDTRFLSRPLDAFPAEDCLQVWPITLPEWPPKPDVCAYRHAWIGVNDAQTFWLDTFTVNRNGAVLATCNAAQGQCEFNLGG